MIFVYFAIHIFIGKRNLQTYIEHRMHIKRLQSNLLTIQNEQRRLQYKIRAVNEKTLDIDLLEEYAISILGYAHPKDIIYITPATA